MIALNFVFVGLSITSSWGNGHATTYRGLVRELVRRGHSVLFLERDVPYYAENRDLPRPPFGRTELYRDSEELFDRFAPEVRAADVVIVGSYVPEGVRVGDWVCRTASGIAAFYDIDTPVTLAALRSGGAPYLAARQLAAYQMYLSFSGGPVLAELAGLGAGCVKPLYCSADAESYRPEPSDRMWDLGYLGTYSSDRQPALDELLLEPARAWAAGSFVVAGPQYPDALGWPANVERRNHVAPPEHRSFYNSQRFTLNVTRKDMLAAGYSPSVRLFEAGACATPVVSDVWRGIEHFFEPEREILLASSRQEVLRYIRELPEAQRVEIGRRARLRVLAEHTAAHRAETLEGYVRELASARARAKRRRPGALPALQPGGES